MRIQRRANKHDEVNSRFSQVHAYDNYYVIGRKLSQSKFRYYPGVRLEGGTQKTTPYLSGQPVSGTIFEPKSPEYDADFLLPSDSDLRCSLSIATLHSVTIKA